MITNDLANKIESELQKKEIEKHKFNDIKKAAMSVYATDAGRIFINHILQYVGYSSFSSDALIMARNEGRRDIALLIQTMLDNPYEQPQEVADNSDQAQKK